MLKRNTECPTCKHQGSHEFSKDLKRIYRICQNCSLVYVPRDSVVSEEEEKKRYEAHENDELDPQYRAYLMNLVGLIMPELRIGNLGLDFGCGKSTLLSQLFEEQGFKINSYDLYFHDHIERLQIKYDFIILSEVIEHLRDPFDCMKHLVSFLNQKGKIIIKTKFYPTDKASFDNWFYKRDITHIQFFNKSSMNHLISSIGVKNNFYELGEDVYCLHID